MDLVTSSANGREKAKREMAKKAISLAMDSRWSGAVAANQAIVDAFPDDLEAYNRLGKAMAELGRNRKAKAAFQRALEISPHNSIAKKNLSRLAVLADEAPLRPSGGGTAPRVFIEESGKAGVTSLIDLAEAKVLLKLAPGHPVELKVSGNSLTACGQDGQYVGKVEPRIASRLTRLLKGGNRYEATVTHVGDQELTVIIREVFKHPSQASSVSFPTRHGPALPASEFRASSTASQLGIEIAEEQTKEGVVVKDWSNDDTEPGDDDAFSPMLHRVVNTADDSADEEL